MQRDQKVGLALGVLLIGAVAAFFFRNEPDPSLRVPSLETAAEVNREIAEKRLTPYFSEIETDEPPRGTRTRPASDSRDVSDARTGERKLPRWEEVKSDPADPFGGDAAASKHVPVPAPDPIQFERTDADSVIGPQPDRNQAWNTADDAVAGSLPASSGVTHEVQKGETLSSIAGKYLGSQARFHDIFEANKDQLRDANDLQVGMILKIPDPKSKSAAATSSPIPKRSKKAPAPKPDIVSQPNTAAVEEPPATEEFGPPPEDKTIPVSAQVSEEPPAEPKPAEAPKMKFTPSKRRPGRTGATATP